MCYCGLISQVNNNKMTDSYIFFFLCFFTVHLKRFLAFFSYRITSFFLYIIFIYLTLFCCCIICTCIKLIIILFYIFRTKRVLLQFTNVLSLPLSLHKNPHPNDFVILWQRNTFQLTFFSQIVVLTHLIQCLVFLNSILNWLGLVCIKNKRKGK